MQKELARIVEVFGGVPALRSVCPDSGFDGTGEGNPGQPGSQEWPNTLGQIFILIVKTMFPEQLEVGGVFLAAFAFRWVWC